MMRKVVSKNAILRKTSIWLMVGLYVILVFCIIRQIMGPIRGFGGSAASSSKSRGKYNVMELLEADPSEVVKIKNYEKNWVPKQPHLNNIAIIMPFIFRQKSRLRLQLALWSARREVEFLTLRSMDACKASSRDRNLLANFTLVWYMDTDFSDTIKDYLTDTFEGLRSEKDCFQGGQMFLSASLAPAENKHPCGPCSMFFKLFDNLPAYGFDYFFIMEPDVLPVRPYWLEAITRELPVPAIDPQVVTDEEDDLKEGNEAFINVPSKDFWMKGSPSMCNYTTYGDIAVRLDFHLNGNGLFKLSDPGFQRFIRLVKEFYPAGPNRRCSAGCETGEAYEGGHDHTFFRFRNAIANFPYSRTIIHRFQQTKTILNYCEDYYDAGQIRDYFPQTFLVHSKGPYLRIIRN